MICTRFIKRNCTLTLYNFFSKASYSRRSDKNTHSYKIIKANGETLDDFDNGEFETNSNWELLTPRGFRFYLPGSIGPGWLDASTTVQPKSQLITIGLDENSIDTLNYTSNIIPETEFDNLDQTSMPMLHCTAQECPILLRKGIQELFPLCLEVNSPQLTIISISQTSNLKKIRWSKEVETEKLTKYFVLAASDICKRLKMIGYWADFINPFSGQPYLNPHKNNNLYQTDERFRCLGFKINHKSNCKVISHENNINNLIGNLYTNAPASTEFLKELLSDVNNRE